MGATKTAGFKSAYEKVEEEKPPDEKIFWQVEPQERISHKFARRAQSGVVYLEIGNIFLNFIREVLGFQWKGEICIVRKLNWLWPFQPLLMDRSALTFTAGGSSHIW